MAVLSSASALLSPNVSDTVVGIQAPRDAKARSLSSRKTAFPSCREAILRAPSRNRICAARRGRLGVCALGVGEKLPALTSLETDESTSSTPATVSLNEVVQNTSVVLFIYPKADTSGCTKQARMFNEVKDKLSGVGYEVFGLSADTPSDQAAWKAAQGYKFPLLSDPSHEALKSLGVSDGTEITRSHFLIEKGGVVKDAKIGVRSGDSVPEALKALGLEP
jgi:peroxiredoxin Q/BCP